MKGALLFAAGLVVGGGAAYFGAAYLRAPSTSMDQHEAMAKELRLAQERLDKCEAGR